MLVWKILAIANIVLNVCFTLFLLLIFKGVLNKKKQVMKQIKK